MVSTAHKQNRSADLREQTFRRLLSWLDQGMNTNGQSYLAIRARLLGYFDRKNCLNADELADETLNRVARRLDEEGGNIETETPARYCYIVARFIFMEHLRETKRADHALGQMQKLASNNDMLMNEAAAEKELRHKCLDRCIGKLDPSSRDLITKYYIGKERAKIENRRSLAESLGISVNALSIRACRIRDRLEKCVRECISHR
jgi:DNA-directed RNA polymerase specialized sigma24 family protein